MKVSVGGVIVQEAPAVQSKSMQEVVEKVTSFGKVALPLSLGAGVLNSLSSAKAAVVAFSSKSTLLATTGNAVAVGTGLADKLQPLIHLVQDLALPVGICTATWGVIEVMLGNPAGTRKIKNSVIGFVAIFIIPYVFYAVRDGLQGGIA
jgi:hypothetical protein